MLYPASPAAQRCVERRLQRDRLETFLVELERDEGGSWRRGTWLVEMLWGTGLAARPPHVLGSLAVVWLHALPGLILGAGLALALGGLIGLLALALIGSVSVWCGLATAGNCRATAQRLELPAWDQDLI